MDKTEQILELIEPFVKEGKILPRTYEQIENNIDDFVFVMNSDKLVACAGLRGYKNSVMCEIYCLAVISGAQKQGHSEKLLGELINKARDFHYSKIFALSKFSTNWFIKNSFTQAGIEDLPNERKDNYDHERSSPIFIKDIN